MLEHLQGKRSFPQTNEELTREQTLEPHIKGQRLHPLPGISPILEQITANITEATARWNTQAVWTAHARWIDTLEWQRIYDHSDFLLKEDDGQTNNGAVYRTAL